MTVSAPLVLLSASLSPLVRCYDGVLGAASVASTTGSVEAARHTGLEKGGYREKLQLRLEVWNGLLRRSQGRDERQEGSDLI